MPPTEASAGKSLTFMSVVDVIVVPGALTVVRGTGR